MVIARLVLVHVLLAVAATAAESEAQGKVLAQVRGLLPPGSTVVDARVVDARSVVVTGGDDATAETVVVGGMPFAAATRVRVARTLEPAYRAELRFPLREAVVPHGHVLLVACWLRAPAAFGGATGVVRASLQLARQPWTSVASASVSVGSDWRLVTLAGTTGQAFAAGDLEATFHLGAQAQTLEFGPLVLLDLGPDADPASLPVMRPTYPGREADAPWRAEAERRIERYRKGDLTVVARRGDGSPAAGMPVTVELRQRAFGIGSFTGLKLLDRDGDGERNRAAFARFDRATVPIYWVDWGWPANRDPYLALAAWGREQGLDLRAHPLVYPSWGFLPGELKALAGDPRALQARILAHIREMGEEYRRFGLREIDVTNELRDCTDIHALVGREGVAEWFAAARAAFPGTRLAINENTILEHGGATEAQQGNYLGWIRDLERLGQKPDVIGFQTHCDDALTPPERVWEILDRFAATGCELQITEFDLNTLDEAVQADYTRDFLVASFAHPAVTAFTMWGFWAGDIWQPGAALYRRDWTPKPSARALEALLDAWTTRASGVTDASGTFRVRGFRGEYAIVVGEGAGAWRGAATLAEAATVTATPAGR